MVGYTGGDAKTTSYKSVCSGDGHTEAIKIEYDPDKLSFEDIMKRVMPQACEHKAKRQYMSAVWTKTAEETEIAKRVAASCGKSAVPILPEASWFDAEEYHQKYVEKSRQQ